jgi:protein ImuB
VPYRGLLLEIGSCLTLFGGYAALRQKILAGIQAQGYLPRHAAAPIAQGALWLALAGEDGTSINRKQLSLALDALSLEDLTTELPTECVTRLGSFGIHTLGAARCLPVAALTRRLGVAATQQIAKAYGEVPDAQPEFVFPEQFCFGFELPAAVENSDALLFACRRLVQALAGWLNERQAGVRACTLMLGHTRQPPTPVPLRFAETLRDGKRIEDVLHERLPRVPLKAPVDTLQLSANSILDLPGQSRPLFQKDGAQASGMTALVERLRARLGETQVHAFSLGADHRPECVSAHLPVGKGNSTVSAARPLFLLDTPQALSEHQGRPQCKGDLLLLAGPERIESGWWDSGESNADGRLTGDVRRDYFVALSSDQRWLWVYRECRAPGGWFLQGHFS